MPFTLGYYFVHKASMSNKDMSIPMKRAVADFVSELNLKHKIKVEANLNYISGRYNFLNLNYKKAKNDLIKVLKSGSFYLRIKSLFIIILISAKFNSKLFK